MGLIVPVGSWVIDKACRQIREWEIYGLGRVPIAVNVSSKQLLEEDFVSQVAKSLHQHRVDPALLEIEITEGTLMEHSDSLDVALRRLKDMKVMISIDDFGTGYSNLAYLKGFLVDALKIDITFIRNVTTDADDATIAAAIINMAHSLRLRVVAEGVETSEQLEFLRVHGCDEAQGYFLSKPLPADQISERFREIISQDAARQLGAQNGHASETHA
jgi:EAL domain-containing protein (putative c-di-GMP-specific phosphodiesterase class I)